MKTFVCDYHLNDPTTFLHHQIQVYGAHARILALGYKHAFSVLHVIDFGNSNIVVLIGSSSFDHVIDVIADDARRLYFVVAG